MSMFKKIAFLLVLGFVMQASSLYKVPASVNYKCMIQMMNYTGERAYVVVSLVDADGAYVKTLYVQGDDDEWYPDIKKWFAFKEKSKENLDAITGATIGNGQRNVISISLDESYMDSGYTIRFESAVENQEYYTVDAEVPLKTATIKNKVEGKGYIRHIRMMPF